METNMIAIQDLIAPALKGLGKFDYDMETHKEGTCESSCIHCYKDRQRWTGLMALKSELLKQIEEVDDELLSPSFL
jgi:hypothetical protein